MVRKTMIFAAVFALPGCGLLGPVGGSEGCIDAVPTFTGRLQSDAGEVSFDTVEVTLEHADESAGSQAGCLTLARITFTQGGALDCSLTVTTENQLDGEGRLLVTGVSLDGSGPCDGFPTDLKATYLELDVSGSGIGFGGAATDPEDTFAACYESYLDVELAGTLAKYSGSDTAVDLVDLTGTTFRLDGPMPSSPVTASCPGS